MVLLCDNVAKGSPLAIGPLAGGEQMMVGLLRLRFAAGVCVLAASLLMGAGGAVAVADPGSSGSAAHGDQHSTDAKKPKDEKKPKDDKKPKDEPGATTPGTGATTPGTGATTPGTGATTPGTGATTVGTGATVTDVVAAVPSLAASVTNAVAPAPNLVAPVSDGIALIQDMPTPVAGAVVPLTQLQSLVQDMLTSVAGVVPLTQLQSDLFSFLLGIAGVAPVSDVSALVQDMLSSVAEAVVLLAQLPSDLFSFLLGIAGAPPIVGGVAGVHGPGLSAAAGASVVSQWRLVLALTGIQGVPLASRAATGVATPGGTAASTFGEMTQVGRAPSLTGMASSAPDAALPIGAGSFLQHVVGEVLLPVSLWALAAGALPGAGGLVILFAAGARLGFRQAKAGFALQAAGIASFARPGAVPLGVVRSGSLVVIRPRASPVVRPGALSAGGRLDKVA